MFSFFKKKKIKLYFSEMGNCYAHMYLVLKDMACFADYSNENLMYVVALIILRKYVESEVIDLQEVRRQVTLGTVGQNDMKFGLTSQFLNSSLEDIIKNDFDECKQLACVIKNVHILKCYTENQQSFTVADARFISLHEPVILEAIKSAFYLHAGGILQKSVNYKEMHSDVEYLLFKTEIKKWLSEN